MTKQDLLQVADWIESYPPEVGRNAWGFGPLQTEMSPDLTAMVNGTEEQRSMCWKYGWPAVKVTLVRGLKEVWMGLDAIIGSLNKKINYGQYCSALNKNPMALARFVRTVALNKGEDDE